MGRHINYYFK